MDLGTTSFLDSTWRVVLKNLCSFFNLNWLERGLFAVILKTLAVLRRPQSNSIGDNL